MDWFGSTTERREEKKSVNLRIEYKVSSLNNRKKIDWKKIVRDM